jgi:chromate reductase, NAD(P)H dehydrogenase (quinone)
VVSSSPGAIAAFGANHHLRQSLVFLNVPALQQPEAYISHVDKLFDQHGKLVSDGTGKFLQAFMQAFAKWIETIRSDGPRA